MKINLGNKEFFEKKMSCGEFLSTKKAAEFLNVSPNALRIKVCRGEVKYYKLGKLLRFLESDLKNLLKQGA